MNLLFAVLVTLTVDSFATPPSYYQPKKGEPAVKAYPSTINFCDKNNERITYVLYDNNNAPDCVLTYEYALCRRGSVADKRCKKKSHWRVITKTNAIVFSRKQSDACLKRQMLLLKKVRHLGFQCEVSGVN